MPEFLVELTTREVANGLWLAVIALLVVALAARKPEVRTSLAGLLALRLPCELVVLLALFAGWLVLVVRFAGDFGFWNEGLAKDTVLWFVVPGLALFASLGDVVQPGNFRVRLIATPCRTCSVG